MGQWRSRCRLAGVGLVVLVTAAAVPLRAMDLADVSMPDRLFVQGQPLRLNGMGLRSFTFLKVRGYVAGLYVPVPTHDPQAILDAPGIKLLRIQYVHAAGAGRVRDEIRRGRRSNCADACPQRNEAAFAQLLGTARAVEPGDTSTYVYGPDGVQVLFDDKPIATIQNPDFARRMLQGMIGAHPPTAALRAGLLGLPVS